MAAGYLLQFHYTLHLRIRPLSPGGSAAKPYLLRAACDRGAQPRITLTQFHGVCWLMPKPRLSLSRGRSNVEG